MTSSSAPLSIDMQEQITRIERMNAETRKFVEESMKFSAETRKLTRDAAIAPFTLIITAFGAGAAVVAAVAAILKLIGP